jgi:iron complex transport system permease protein
MKRYYAVSCSALVFLLLASAFWMVAEHQSSLSEALYIQSAVSFKLPRVLMGALAGGLFAVAGAILQDTMRNKISSPDILGISAISILCVLGFKNFNPDISWLALSAVALAGSAVGFVLLFFVAQQNGKLNIIKFVLIGVTIGIICKAGIQWLLQHSSPQIIGSLSYMVGSTYGVGWQKVKVVGLFTVPLYALAVLNYRFFKYFPLSDDRAKSIGVQLSHIRKLNITIAIVCTTVAVLGIGNLGFVGLVAPNIARLLCRNNKFWFLIFSILLGMILVVMAEALASLIFYPIEVPVGVVTTVIGAPYFIWVVHRHLR